MITPARRSRPVIICEATTHCWTLDLFLEPHEVTDESVDHPLPNGWSEVHPHSSWDGGSGVGDFGVIPCDRVGDRIHDFEVFRERAGGDLVAVSWITPSTEPARPRITEDRRVREVGVGVYDIEQGVSVAGDGGHHGWAD